MTKIPKEEFKFYSTRNGYDSTITFTFSREFLTTYSSDEYGFVTHPSGIKIKVLLTEARDLITKWVWVVLPSCNHSEIDDELSPPSSSSDETDKPTNPMNENILEVVKKFTEDTDYVIIADKGTLKVILDDWENPYVCDNEYELTNIMKSVRVLEESRTSKGNADDKLKNVKFTTSSKFTAPPTEEKFSYEVKSCTTTPEGELIFNTSPRKNI